MSEKIELKPCPFCGKSAYLSDVSDCIGCVGTCPIAGDAITLEDWNNRPVEDAQAARIAELERTVDELRGELAQSDRVADKARIAELEEILVEILENAVVNGVYREKAKIILDKKAIDK